MQKKPGPHGSQAQAPVRTSRGNKSRANKRKPAIPETKQLFRSLLDNLGEVIFRVDTQGVLLYISSTISSVIGFRPSEIIGRNFAEFIHPEDLPGLLKSFEVTLGGKREPFEFRILHKDGSIRHVHTSSSILREGEQIAGLVGVLSDLTERKQFEESLKEIEIQYRLLFDNAPIGIGVADSNGRLLAFNDAILKPGGYTRRDIKKIGSVDGLFYEASDRELVLAEFRSRGRVDTYLVRFKRKDGSAYETRLSLTAIEFQGQSCLQAIVEDVSSQRNAERSLHELENKYRSIVEQLPAAVYIDAVDTVSTTLYISPQVEAMTEYPAQEWLRGHDLWVRILHPEDRERVLAENERTNRTGDPFRIEYRMLARSGRTIWVRDESRLLRDVDGKPLYWHGLMLDITNQKTAELARDQALEELRRKEEQFRLMVELSPQPMIIHSEGKIVYANPATLAMMRAQAAEQILGKPLIDFVHPDFRKIVTQHLRKAVRARSILPVMQEKFLRVDGSVIDVEVSAIPVTYQGKPGMQVLMNDITERKQAETALRESEEKYRTVVDYAFDAILVVKDSLIVYANPRVSRMIGLPVEQVCGRSFLDFIHPEDLPRILQDYEQRASSTANARSYGVRLLDSASNLVIVEAQTSVIPFEGGRANLVFLRDVTRQRAAQEALQRAELRYQTLVESLPIVIYRENVDQPSLFTYISPQIRALLGYSAEEWTQDPGLWPRCIHPDDREWVMAEDARTDRTGDAFHVEYRMLTRDQRLIWIRDEAVLVRDEAGQPHFWQGYLLDITQTKQVETALRDSEASYRGLFDTVSEAIYIQDIEGKFLDVNLGAVKMYGHPREYLVGKTPAEISAPGKNDLEAVREAVARAFQGEPQQFEFWGLRSSGEIFPKEVRLYKGAYFGQDVIIAFAQDITERKLAEKSLRESEEKFRRIIENSPMGMLLYELDSQDQLIFIGANPAADRLLGVKHAEFIGKPMEIIFPALAETEIPVRYRQTAALGIPWETEQVDYQDKNIRGAFQVFAFQTSQNRLAVLFQDVTERKRSESEIQRRLKETTVLHAIAQAGTRAVIVDDLIEQVTGIITETFQLDSFGFMLYDPEAGALHTHPSYHGEFTSDGNRSVQLGSGITGATAAARHALRVADTRVEARYLEINPGMRSELCVPILAGPNLVGVINAESRLENYFSEEDERLLVTIADSMATAIEKLRLFEAEHTRRQEAEILREATTAMATSLELHHLLDAILASAEKIVPHDSASVILREGGALRIVAGRGLPEKASYLGRIFRLNDIWQAIITSRQAMILKDAQAEPGWDEWDGSGYIHSWMGIPLLVRGEVIGCLCLDSRRVGVFTQEHATLMQTFANQAAAAIENARLFAAERDQRQRQESMIDLMRVAGSSLDLAQVITSVLHHLVQLVPCQSATLQLLEAGKLRIEASVGFSPTELEQIRCMPLEEFPLNRQVLQTKQAAWVDDTQVSDKYVKVNGLDSIRSFLVVPLLYKDNPVGVVTLDSPEPGRFNALDADLAFAIANNAAVVIENARLYEAERVRRQEADTLREATAAVTSTLDQKTAIDLILEQLALVVSYDSASVQLLDGDFLEIVGGRGWKDIQAVLGMRFPVPGENPNTVVIQTRQPYILENAGAVYMPFKTGVHSHIRSWLGVPMVVRDRVIGMLAVDSTHAGHFNQESARLVGAFANQAAAAIENSRLYQQALQASERQVILHQASQEIARVSQVPEKVYEAVHRAAARLMPAEAFVITILDETQTETLSVYLVDKGGRWPPVRSPRDSGLSGHVIESGASLIISDLERQGFSNGIHFGEADEVRSILAVPLRSGERIMGMISTQSYQPNVYSEEDQALLEMLAAHASVAIENARLYEVTQRRLKELELVNRVSTELRIAKKVSEMLPMLLDQALKILGSDSGTIWLYDAGMGILKTPVSRGWFTAIQEEPVRPGEGIAGLVFTTGKPILSKDFAQDPLSREITRGQLPPGWGGACVPIRTMQETIGVMFVSVQLPRQLQEDEVHLLETLCEIAGNALRRADLHEQTERQLQRLASLRAIDMAISTILDLRVTLGVLLDHITAQLHVDAVDILLLNQNTQSLNHAASTGFRTDAIRHTQLFIGDELAGRAVRTREILHLPDLSKSSNFTRAQALAGEEFKTYFGVPLIAKGQVKGVLEIFQRQVIDPDPEWRSFLETLAGQAAIAIDNSVLFEELQQTNMDLSLAYDATIEGWSKALDLRDRETEGHTLRVTDMTLQLAEIMRISSADRIHIRRGTLLHDIGKMGVPDSILNKEGPLTEDEWVIMRRHPEFAHQMLSPISYLRPALEIPYCHHERWDGSGYPRKLRGEQIPLVARIFAVVDVWDALISDRPYRKRWTRRAAINYIRENSGVLFDPRVVEQFIPILNDSVD